MTGSEKARHVRPIQQPLRHPVLPHSAATLPKGALLRLPQVLTLIPIGRSTWWSWIKEKKAPAGLKLGPRITAWRVEDICALIDRLGNEASERKET